MKIIIFILSIIVFFKTFLYGIYEIKQQKNISGGVAVIAISFICIIGTNVIMQIR